jgi:hypothetical protein
VISFDSKCQFHPHPNDKFGIVTHFQCHYALLLNSIQYQAFQYLHPNTALLLFAFGLFVFLKESLLGLSIRLLALCRGSPPHRTVGTVRD